MAKIRTIEEVKNRYFELEKNLQNPAVFNDQKKIKELSQEYSELKEIVEKTDEAEALKKNIDDAEKTLDTYDDELKELANEEIEILRKKLEKANAELLVMLIPPDPLDKKNIIVEIRAGAGGDESALFSADLFRMYSRFAEDKHWKVTVLSSNRIGIGGFKEIIFEIEGNNVYKHLKYESGVHRVQRIPETEKSGRVHTSTATVAILPAADEIDVQLKPEDMKIEANTATGNGGQSVNTTYSAIRITHIPTGIVINCQDERSQSQNKEKALAILRSRVFSMEQERQQNKRAKDRRTQIGTGDRSEKIRTYNFPQDRVTDHRIKLSCNQISKIMDGKLDTIIDALHSAEIELNS